MKDQIATINNLSQVFNQIQTEIEEKRTILISTQGATTGKWGMAQLWRVWIQAVSDYAAANGVTMPLCITPDGTFIGTRPFNKSDGHELFTANFMGTDETGQRLSWAKNKAANSGRPATAGERFHALRQLEQYALERGIPLIKPRESEYAKLEQEENNGN